MQIGNLNLKGRVVLAPLAGVSNRPFRVLAKLMGAALTYTEMVSSEGIIRYQKKTLAYMAFKPDEQPIGIQLFGANPEVMRKASEIVVKEYKPDLVDINFGCPVKKVVNKNGGAAVLKDLSLTEAIIKAVVSGAGSTPVTIKMRTGWDDKNPIYLKAGEIAEKCGIKAVCLHARSRSVGYAGQADWSAIKKLKDTVGIPVIGNGDVFSPADVERMLQTTGCDAVMIGRAAMGNPFIFKQANSYLDTGQIPDMPSIEEKIQMVNNHARLMIEEYGEKRGIIKMRKYLGWYVKGFPKASQLRQELMQVTSLTDIESILNTQVLEH